MGQYGVLSKEFAEKIKGMAGFRNILVHDYIKLDLFLLKKTGLLPDNTYICISTMSFSGKHEIKIIIYKLLSQA